MSVRKLFSFLPNARRQLSSTTLEQRTPRAFRIVEVGPRDGLQNEKKIVPTSVKVEFINRLSKCGFAAIETTSFVSNKKIPQLADNAEVFNAIKKMQDVSYPVLVPNMSGLENALKCQSLSEIAVFCSASESFSQQNTKCSVAEGLHRMEDVTKEAIKHGLRVRAYLSMVIGCPFDGPTSPKHVADLVARLLYFGCYEVSLGDTIGVGSPGSVGRLLDEISRAVPAFADRVAVHFHDTYGQALSNVLVALERGVRVADSSVGGLGGCPFARVATGNLATEDLVYMLQGLGVETGINLDRLVETSDWIFQTIGRQNQSRVATAILTKKNFQKLFDV